MRWRARAHSAIHNQIVSVAVTGHLFVVPSSGCMCRTCVSAPEQLKHEGGIGRIKPGGLCTTLRQECCFDVRVMRTLGWVGERMDAQDTEDSTQLELVAKGQHPHNSLCCIHCGRSAVLM
jgi:hypothetical protein